MDNKQKKQFLFLPKPISKQQKQNIFWHYTKNLKNVKKNFTKVKQIEVMSCLNTSPM
jgi:hypothetical protein